MGTFVWASVSIASSLLALMAEIVALIGKSVHRIDVTR